MKAIRLNFILTCLIPILFVLTNSCEKEVMYEYHGTKTHRWADTRTLQVITEVTEAFAVLELSDSGDRATLIIEGEDTYTLTRKNEHVYEQGIYHKNIMTIKNGKLTFRPRGSRASLTTFELNRYNFN